MGTAEGDERGNSLRGKVGGKGERYRKIKRKDD